MPADRPARWRPVDRGALFAGATLRLHDNACCRTDAGLSPETEPLEFHELVFPRSGLWVRHTRRHTLAVDSYHAHLFARGDTHRVSHPEGCGDRNTGLVLSRALVDELDPGGAAFEVPMVALDDRTYARHHRLVRDARAGFVDALELEERALTLARDVLHRARRDAGGRAEPAPARDGRTRRAHVELAHEARALLAARFREAMSLDELAAALDVSVFHLCRVFRAEIGATLHAYRVSLRVREALRWLADPELTLHDVAARSGFADRTQLHRAVRRALGRAPGELRARDAEQGMPRPG